jgi:hypothetical protein
MAQRAVTIVAYALVDVDDYDERLGEIISGLESGLQQAGASYVGPQVINGIPPEISDTL